MHVLYHILHLANITKNYYKSKSMIQFAPAPRPKTGELWVDHAAELPTSPQRKMFDGHMTVQMSALERRAKTARNTQREVAHKLAGGAVGAIETAKGDMAKLPTGDPDQDRKSAYNGLCALAMGRLVNRFFDNKVEPLFNLVELGVLTLEPEIFLCYENEQTPTLYSLHLSRELLAPQVATPLPKVAQESWYKTNGLYLMYQSPSAPLEMVVGDLTPQEAAQMYAGTCTIRPFLAAPSVR
jgi:hypothetical protein